MADQVFEDTRALVNEMIAFVKQKAELFGGRYEGVERKDFIFRNNTGREALEEDGAAYFGFISPEEEASGAYHDLSLVVFPGPTPDNLWLVALGIGTLGYKNDYELAIVPGLRRSFAAIVNTKKGYLKTSLLDMETKLPNEFTQKIPGIPKVLSTYGKLLPVCEIVDPKSDEGKAKISAFLAVYANIRQWATNNTQRTQIRKAIEKCATRNEIDDENEVLDLIQHRKFVVLQGAPGTGKTRLALIISEKMNAKQFFTQFHAETSYSDFIFGIRPDVNKEELQYKNQKGVFYEAIEYSLQNPDQKIVLIIDEINRANLANVLGPIFYLFEYESDHHDVPVLIGGDLKVTKIPDNFYVLATMNTADRSLAMVDFALRRRFAWYTLYPRIISNPLGENRKFFQSEFEAMDNIFKWYASNEEMVFQPGHSYFIAKTDEEMKNRIRYELYPLINEYLAEGILLKAKEDLIHYFRERLGGEIVS